MAALAIGTLPLLTVVSMGAAGAGTAPGTSSPIASGRALVLRELKSGQIGGPIRGLRTLSHASSPSGTSFVDSLNWAGYADDHSSGTTYTRAVGSWTQPSIARKCRTVAGLLTVTSTWVGLDGYGSRTVEQEGTSNVCAGGHGYAYDWYEMYPAGSVGVHSIGAKDVVTATTATNGTGTYILAVQDTTHPADGFGVFKSCSRATCLDQSAEWISEAPCCSAETASGYYPLTPFRTWALGKARSNAGDIASYPNDNITQANDDFAYPLQTTGNLTRGTRFTVTFRASD